MNLISIDPGTRCVGWAYFEDEILEDCGLLRTKETRLDNQVFSLVFEAAKKVNQVVDNLVVEIPQVYQQRLWKGDPNDLIKVAVVAGAMCGGIAAKDICFFVPREWKGNVPKDIHNRRILKKLEQVELDVYETTKVPQSLLHNVIDAIGIGLHALGR